MIEPAYKINSKCIGKNLGISGIHVITDKKASVIRRTIWILLLFSMFGVMLWQVERRLQSYFSNPIAVNVQVKHEKSVRFPVILICNLNIATISGTYGWLDSSYIISGIMNNNFYQFLKDYRSLEDKIKELNGKSYIINKTLETFVADQPWVTYSDIYFGGDDKYKQEMKIFVKTISHNFGKMLKKCLWQNAPCSEHNFTLVYNPENLNYCFAFNSNNENPLYTKQSGPTGALKLIMDVQQYEYVHSDNGGAGLKVIIMDELIMDDPGRFSGDALLVPAGSIVSVALSRQNYSEIKPPIGTCNETHSISQCIDDCVTRYVIDQCGCQTEWMRGNAPYCNFLKKLTCANNKADTFLSSAESDNYCNCAPKCTRTEYRQSVTSAIWAEYDMTSKLLTHQCPDNLDKIGRLQDWAYLEQTDRNLTRKLFKVSRQFFMEYYFKVLIPISDKLKYYTNAFSDILHNQNDNNAYTFYLLSNTSSLAFMLNRNQQILMQNIIRFFSYEFCQTKNNCKDNGVGRYASIGLIPDDFFVHIANDILRHNGKYMKTFYSSIMDMFMETQSIFQSFKANTIQISEKLLCPKIVQDPDSLECSNTQAYVNESPENISEDQLSNLSKTIQSFDIDGLSKDYGYIRNGFKAVYNDLFDVLKIVQNNPTLLNTRDWAKITTEEFYKLNYVGLDIYYESLSTTRTSQFETDSLTSLICDLGGNIGLWLGGSILTLFEIVDLTFIILNPSRVIGKLGVFKGKSPIKLSSSKRKITNCTVIDIEEKGV